VTGITIPTAYILGLEHPFGHSSKGALMMVDAAEKTDVLIVLTLSKVKGKVHIGPCHGSGS
jgi:hypothetical protein